MKFSYTHRKDIAGQEESDLSKLANKFRRQVEAELSLIRDEPVTLFLNQNDEYRLLTLKTWTYKYKVSLKFILDELLPFWEQFVQRRSKRMKKAGLNVRVSTLIGKKSEVILQEQIKKRLPRDQNKRLWISLERERIFVSSLSRDRDQFTKKLKHMTEYKDPRKWAKAYQRMIEEEQRLRDSIVTQLEKRPYRGNPFREETV